MPDICAQQEQLTLIEQLPGSPFRFNPANKEDGNTIPGLQLMKSRQQNVEQGWAAKAAWSTKCLPRKDQGLGLNLRIHLTKANRPSSGESQTGEFLGLLASLASLASFQRTRSFVSTIRQSIRQTAPEEPYPSGPLASAHGRANSSSPSHHYTQCSTGLGIQLSAIA